ncbi:MULTISPECIES: clostripain-related cysteine peptidase [unclassified Fusibacter]|uniref:clostripain-related cysteine peptidase n=1 Tax=unclassified Fusibacter TaxID=2624464 RepID=UPI001011CFBD|nr:MULTISPECIES: clostripain-related cysteine peptidase [unclassified Fusibacter]MCK8060235.1 clostripain-related cysteine peptidase [Fusibacter sp. A2]NPE22374.1 zinc-ribbon domain-containing protein [Fusibacter sp. A1]RXV61146.1 zinc-ribbon domain-containing protein [Fusibacter sp. A1]
MGNSKFCTMCGEPLEENSKFCGSCGSPVAGIHTQDAETSAQADPVGVTEQERPSYSELVQGSSVETITDETIHETRAGKKKKSGRRKKERKREKKKGGCLKKALIGLVLVIAGFIGLVMLLPDSEGPYDGEDVFTSGNHGTGDNQDTSGSGGADSSDGVSDSDSLGGGNDGGNNNSSDPAGKAKYTFMVFMNGTDLESDGGAATTDILEMAAYGSSRDVNIILETGGTKYWQNEVVDGSQNQRFKVTKDSIELLGNEGLKNIGDPDTLYDFIVWTVANYPAEKYVLDLWNHGGGPLYGYGSDDHFEVEDQSYRYPDHLSIDEIETALRRAKEATGVELEILGFDACLMATVEVAFMAQPFAKYMVASEETEPGHGWDYKGIFAALNANPDMGGAELGKIICDTYQKHSEANDTDSMITLSVVDLSYISDVVLALEDMSVEFMMNMDDVRTFNTVSYGRNNAESYGRNNMFTGYTELIDLYDFARHIEGDQAFRAEELMKAIDLAVVYKIQGPERYYSGGLSIFFPYMDKAMLEENLAAYRVSNPIDMYETFVEEFISAENSDTRSILFEASEPEMTDDNVYSIIISEEDANNIASIYNYLGLVLNEEMTAVMSLGMDTNVNYDPETGIVSDNFQGYWTGLNDHLVTIYVVEDTAEYNLYNIPAYINGQRADIVGKWTWDESHEDGGYYSVVGAWAVTDDGEIMADKDFFQLEIGDTVEAIFEAYNSETYEVKEALDDPFVLEEEAYLDFLELPTGETFMYGFYIVDYAQNGDFSGFEIFNYKD